MAFVKIGSVGDIQPGTAQVFEVGEGSIAVCNTGGKLYAVDNVCTHDEGPLGEGELEGFEVECPRHGARFDVRTGEVTGPPANLAIDTFPVRINGDEIEIDL